ncbi:MAG: UDP-glucose/GDP-mannose dehydrogenase family protein [bacterium]
MNIVVIGTGYVGLAQGACLAHLGHQVVCVDVDANKVARLSEGVVPFFEPKLEDLVRQGVGEGRLSFTIDLADAMSAKPEVVFLAVPTPQGSDGRADLGYLESASRDLRSSIDASTLVVIKSTVPPGTCKKVCEWIGGGVDVASNPEFLREGTAVDGFLKPDRIVLGVTSADAEQKLRDVYSNIDAPVFTMSPESAELSKYAANTFLASRLSLINEIANIADHVGADIKHVEAALGADPRIGNKFLRSGAGFGGSCFPKDVLALDFAAREHGYEPKLIAPIIDVNNDQAGRFVKKIQSRLGSIEGKKLAVWGLAFNKGTDDVRESPAVRIVECLLGAGATISVFDPKAMGTARAELGEKVTYAPSMMDALIGADALLVLTEWEEFIEVPWRAVKELLREPVIFDGKNFLPHDDLRSHGFEVIGIGVR